MLHQQGNQLLPVHERDGSLIRLNSFILCTLAEIARGDDQALFMCPKGSSQLLYDRSLHIALPTLGLDSHFYPDHIPDHQGTPDVDSPVPAIAGHLNHLETHSG